MDNSFIDSLKNNLLKRHGVLGKDKYFNSAVLIPLILSEGEYHLLFEKRAGTIRQGGEVSFPGGGYDGEKDKNYRDTALRETYEEIGIPEDKIEVLGEMDTLVAPMGVTVDPFLGLLHIRNLNELKIDEKEVERVFTIPVSYFIKTEPSKYFVRLEVHTKKQNKSGEIVELLPVRKLRLPESYSSPWKGRKHRILVYETSEETVWGITAELVYEFCKLLEQEP